MSYNKNAMAAYQQYGQTMTASGGGRNMSGLGARSSTSSMTSVPSGPVDFTTIDTKTGKQTKVATITDYGDDDNGPTVLYTNAANAATAAGVDLVKAAAKPSVDASLLYSEPRFNIEQQATKIEDYLRGTAVQDALIEAQGFEKPYTGLYVAEDRPMTEAELQKYKPLIDMADDIMNENITVEELGDMDREDQEAFLRAIGVQGLGPAKRESSFVGGDFDVATTEEEFVRDLLNQGLSKKDESFWDRLFSFREKKKEEVEIPGTAYLMDKPEMGSAPSKETPPTIDTTPPAETGKGLMSRPSPETLPEQGPVLYPSNERSVLTYARDVYPNNPEAAAALAATIQFEGMEDAEEDVSKYSWNNITSSSSAAGWLKDTITKSNRPWAKKRTSKLYQLYGGEPKTDADGKTIPLTREPTKEELKSVQRELKEGGFYKGAIDGIFGKSSKAALKSATGKDELDVTTAGLFDLELRLKDHEGNPMIEYERPTNPVVPAGEKVVDITYNPYYRANGYSDQLRDVSKEGLEGNTPGSGTFRGRGPVQITNKTMYEKLRKQVLDETGVDILKNPSAVADDLAVSKAATVAFLDEVGFDKLPPKEALKAINPQMPSSKLNKRLEAYNKYLKELKK